MTASHVGEYGPKLTDRSEKPTGIAAVCVDFECYRLVNTELSWINQRLIEPNLNKDTVLSRQLHDEMLQEFSYAVPDNEYFPLSAFDTTSRRIMYAERYGGRGLGGNGGGSRCGNWRGIQVKGVGKNPLVGSDVDWWHATGALDLAEAVLELIYSEVLRKVLPRGTVDCYGIISTKLDVPYYEDGHNKQLKLSTGALLLREPEVRPAHFIRSPYFKPRATESACVETDVDRTRRAVNGLTAAFTSKEELGRHIASCLRSNAEQFAAARVMRVAHGAVTPSNVCLSGAWIDLSTCSLLPSGKNFMFVADQAPFYLESYACEMSFVELLDTINKYSQYDFETERFRRLYKRCFEASYRKEICLLLGLDVGVSAASYHRYLNVIIREVTAIIHEDTKVAGAWPKSRVDKDPLVEFLESIYTSVGRRPVSSNDDGLSMVRAFKTLLRVSYERFEKSSSTYNNFKMKCAIRVFRRELLREVFFRGRIVPMVRSQALSNTKGVEKLVEEFSGIASWVFNTEEQSNIIVLQLERVRIEYCSLSGRFVVDFDGDRCSYENLGDIRIHISSIEEKYLVENNYNYKDYINRLLAMLVNI